MPKNMPEIREGDRVRLSGDSKDLWISDYNVRVNTQATVVQTPAKHAKKLLVIIDEIDGDHNVTTLIRRSRAIPNS